MRLTRALLSLLVVAALPLAARAQELTADTKRELLAGVEKIVLTRAFVPGVALDRWPAHLERHRAAVDAAQRPEDLVRAVNSALREFGVSHIRMLTPASEKRRVTHQRTDLGLRVQPGKSSLAVVEVRPESMAATGGIQVGDSILTIDGRPALCAEDLDGADGSQLSLGIRTAAGETRDVELMRKVVSTDRADTLTWLDDETAVLHIHTFTQGYQRAAIEKLCAEAAKARHLLLDLRGNGGGATNNLRHLLGQMLPAGAVIGTFVSREIVRAFVAANQGDGKDPVAVASWTERKFRTDPRSEPKIHARVAVLINRGSASASEITAAALREVLDAPLVGARPAGAVLASNYAKLEGGYALQFPQSDYVTGAGVRLERHPLVPDLVVGAAESRPSSRPGSAASRPRAESVPTVEMLRADPVVKAAVELLKTRAPRPASRPAESRPSSGPSRQDPAPASQPTSRGRRRREVPV